MDIRRYLAEGTGPTTKANARLADRWEVHNGQRTQQIQAQFKQQVQSNE